MSETMWTPSSSRATVIVKQEQQDDDDDGDDNRNKQIHLVISMDIELKPIIKKEQDGDTLPATTDEQRQHGEDNKDIKFIIKTELDNDNDENGQASAEDDDQGDGNAGHRASRARGKDDRPCGVPTHSTVCQDDSDSDSDYDDDDMYVVKVKDILNQDEVEQMLSRCQQVLDLEDRPPLPDDRESKSSSLSWSLVSQEKRERRIKTIRIFTDARLNEMIGKILLLPDSLTSMARAVQYLSFVFWTRRKLSSFYLPDILTVMPDIKYGQEPLRGYKLFFAIFMHILRISSPAKFEAHPVIDAIAAEVCNWDTWFLFKKSGNKRTKRRKQQGKKSRKRGKREADEEEEDNDDDDWKDSDLAPIIHRCIKRLDRQPPDIELDGEIMWPRMYDLRGSMRQAGKVFPVRKLQSLLTKLLLTDKSTSSLSGAVDNMGRVFWSRQEIRDHKFPSPKDLLNPAIDWEHPGKSFLKHSVRFYEIFMRIRGQHRKVREFAATRLAEDVYRAFRAKFV